MVDLKQIFMAVKVGLQDGNTRYSVKDDEHVIDEDTGVKYHLYSQDKKKPFEITIDGETVLDGRYMTDSEAMILDQVRKMLPSIHAENKRQVLFDLLLNDTETDGGSGGYNGGLR